MYHAWTSLWSLAPYIDILSGLREQVSSSVRTHRRFSTSPLPLLSAPLSLFPAMRKSLLGAGNPAFMFLQDTRLVLPNPLSKTDNRPPWAFGVGQLPSIHYWHLASLAPREQNKDSTFHSSKLPIKLMACISEALFREDTLIGTFSLRT